MIKFDYLKICSELLSNLKKREKEVLSRRFGLAGHNKETLESIGNDFGLSRERIRQIEVSAMKKVKSHAKDYKKVFEHFERHLKKFGGLRSEEELLEELGGEDNKNEVFFLLNLDDSIKRFNEADGFHNLWILGREKLLQAKEVVEKVTKKLEEKEEPVPLVELKDYVPVDKKVLASYLGAASHIQDNDSGLYGLASWPEINPKGVKDKAYIVLKKAGRPLHFTKVAQMIDGGHVQTVHNELIKDNRFVLVGRGIYALAEWGYYPGQVKDVIKKVLEESGQPLGKKEIINKVMEQRVIKKNTILLNLSNNENFKRDSEGRYTIKEA